MDDAGDQWVDVVEFDLAEGVAGNGCRVVVGNDQLQGFTIGVSQIFEAVVDSAANLIFNVRRRTVRRT
jgi:hypothetical protein